MTSTDKSDSNNEQGKPAQAPKKMLKIQKRSPQSGEKKSVVKPKVVVKKKKIIIRKDKESPSTPVAETQKTERPPTPHSSPSKSRRPKPLVPATDAPPISKDGKGEKEKSHGHGYKKGNSSKRRENSRDKFRDDDRVLAKIAKKKRQQDQEADRISSVPKMVEIMENVTVGDLAKKMNLRASDLITKLLSMGTMARVNDILDRDTATILAEEFNCSVKVISLSEEAKIEVSEDKEEDMSTRAPVVTIMGHVDHGKTKLLDYIRSTNVAAKESGGITQHIGAYKLKTVRGEIAFIDTPGHAAFTMMRSRGAHVTDIVVLVVASDDGVMPQTIEAINHAKAAGVPIIVAINKMDLPQANVERIQAQLSEFGLMSEEWGGDTLYAKVSALTGEGVDALLDSILLQSEMLELKANPKRDAIGTVLESSLDVGRGPVGTVLVQNGTLKIGDYFIAGVHAGKVRAMFDDRGRKIKTAPPSTPVEVLGFEDVPEAGEQFFVMNDEKEAKMMSDKRKHLKQIEGAQSTVKVTLDNLFEQIKDGEMQEFKVIIKADVQGSVEALKESLAKLSNDHIRFVSIHGAPGAINESDVMLAETSNASIIAYRVRASAKIKDMAEKAGVELKQYDIIYEAIDDVERGMKGMVKAEKEEVDTATVEVRDVFKISKVGTIAGCYVTSGKIERTNIVRLVRDGVLVYTGKISSLKRFKDDVKEVASGYECGISIENFNDIKNGDVIEAFEIREKAIN